MLLAQITWGRKLILNHDKLMLITNVFLINLGNYLMIKKTIIRIIGILMISFTSNYFNKLLISLFNPLSAAICSKKNWF